LERAKVESFDIFLFLRKKKLLEGSVKSELLRNPDLKKKIQNARVAIEAT
jgi:hypothetical protein